MDNFFFFVFRLKLARVCGTAACGGADRAFARSRRRRRNRNRNRRLTSNDAKSAYARVPPLPGSSLEAEPSRRESMSRYGKKTGIISGQVDRSSYRMQARSVCARTRAQAALDPPTVIEAAAAAAAAERGNLR